VWDSVKELRQKVAVVTGGASGIGRALSEAFAAEGMKVVLADVDGEALRKAEEEMASGGATVASKRTDVRQGEDLEALAKFAVETFEGANVLCNNAGIGIGGGLWQQTSNDWEWMLGVNLMGVVHGIRAFVPVMLAQGDECHIVNTASAAGLTVRPFLGMYAATKHAVVALSEALYHELNLAGSKIGVSVLCPAVVNTRIGESERNRPQDLANNAAEANPAQMAAMEQAFRAALAAGLPPEEVARAVVDAIREERFYILTHEDTKSRVRTKMEDILEGRNPTLTA
jgi:NAD(P)-dependent dehydrogenase (short-subunit alcohol dehydrogenase family)